MDVERVGGWLRFSRSKVRERTIYDFVEENNPNFDLYQQVRQNPTTTEQVRETEQEDKKRKRDKMLCPKRMKEEKKKEINK